MVLSQDLPCTPAAARLRDLLALFSAFAPSAIAAYIDAHFTEANQKLEPLSSRIGFFHDWHARGPITIVQLRKSEPQYIETLIEQQFSKERWLFAIQVAALSPHPIDKVLAARAPLPIWPTPADDHSAASRFIDYMDHLAQRDLFSGVVLLARNGSLLAHRPYGVANRDFNIPNTLATRFNVASLTKSWTAIAAAQLIESKQLSFDDAVARFVAYPEPSSAKRIQIKHLLSHTSGLQDYFTDELYRTPRHHIRTIDDYLALSRHQLPSFAPGAKWSYSNTGMVLLGKIIDIITGSYLDHVDTNIFKRANMEDAEFIELDHVNSNVAIGYTKTWTTAGPIVKNNIFENFVGGCPAGGAYATSLDIFRFAEAFTANRLVSREMATLLTTPKPELNAPDYGFGFAIHTNRALYGHSGGMLGASANLDITLNPPGWVAVVLANELTMRAPVLKARQILGVPFPETEAGRAYLPRTGLTPR
jgi:CubicO group peptidase (beta-lactamase class C family)